MSKDIFDRLVKIGNRNPELRDNISPLLHHLKTAAIEMMYAYDCVIDRSYAVLEDLSKEGIIDASESPFSLDEKRNSREENDMLYDYWDLLGDFHANLYSNFTITPDEYLDPEDYQEDGGTYYEDVRTPHRDPGNPKTKSKSWSVEYPRYVHVNYYVKAKETKGHIVKRAEKHLLNRTPGNLTKDALPDVHLRALADYYMDLENITSAGGEVWFRRADLNADRLLENTDEAFLDEAFTEYTETRGRGTYVSFSDFRGDLTDRDRFDLKDVRVGDGSAGFSVLVRVSADADIKSP